MAKSLGYGKIELKISGISNINNYLKEFELEIGKQIVNWAESEQLQELLSMATQQNNQNNSRLKYMELKEFAKNKTGDNQDYLGVYTSLSNIKKIKPKSLLSEDENKNLIVKREEIKQEIQKKLEEEARLKAEKEALELEVQKQKAVQEQQAKEEQEAFDFAIATDNIQIIKNFIDANPEHPNLAQLQARINDLQTKAKEKQFEKVNEEAQKAFDSAMSQKDKNKRKQWLQAWIKKWEVEKNNKGSKFILELIEKAKKESK